MFIGIPGAADAATYYWDADGSATTNDATNGLGLGGNGIWNTTSSLWWDGTNPTTPWTNPNTAVFTGAGGVVSLGSPIIADGLTFNTAGVFITGNSGSNTFTLTSGAVITLNHSGTDTISAVVARTDGFNIVNTCTTYLFNAANDFTGTVWAQNGTLAAFSLSDAPSAGNIKLGNAATAATLQWASGAAGPLVLTNRKIELAGTTGGATNFNDVNDLFTFDTSKVFPPNQQATAPLSGSFWGVGQRQRSLPQLRRRARAGQHDVDRRRRSGLRRLPPPKKSPPLRCETTPQPKCEFEPPSDPPSELG